MKKKITNVIKTTDGRELCPICGEDVTIIKMHSPCAISWGENFLWYIDSNKLKEAYNKIIKGK